MNRMKMMKGNGMIALLAALMMVACTDPKKEKVDTLRAKAIEVHDEVMPRLGEIMSTSGQLKQLREQVVVDSLDSTGAARRVFTVQIADLEAAHEAMMAWMADYDPSYEVNHPMDSAIAYYEGQIEAILTVKKAMEQSIEDGKKLVDAKKK
ncbi:MAG: hypothetical protein RLP15_13440 [Cryomorphaceae bacterium]